MLGRAQRLLAAALLAAACLSALPAATAQNVRRPYVTGSPGNYIARNYTDLYKHLKNAAAYLIIMEADIAVEATLHVNRQVVLRGNCHDASAAGHNACTLSRMPSGRLMQIHESVKGVVVENLIFSDGGAAISLGNHSTTYFWNCAFNDNTAGVNGDSGAVFFEGTAEATFQTCAFTNNQANQGDATGVGGAVYLRRQSKAAFLECNFMQNNAETGGAVYIKDNATVEFKDCHFYNNHAGGDGGAVMAGGAAHVLVERCHFISNSAVRGGAVFAAETATVIFRNSNFTANTAVDQGGGIAVFDATDPLQEPQAGDSPLVTFLGCLWSDNTAGDIQTRDTFADGVYNTLLYKTFTPTGSPTKAPTVSPEVYVNNPIEFIQAIHNKDVQVVVIMRAIDFAQFTPADLVFERDIHIEGDPTSNDEMHLLGGGKVFFTVRNNATLSLQYLRLQDFGSGGPHGAILTDMYATFIGREVSFMYNRATVSGGAVFLGPHSTGSCTLCTFNSNSAGTTGGAVHVGYYAEFNCKACVFGDNQAGKHGPDIYGEARSLSQFQGPDDIRCAELLVYYEKHAKGAVSPDCEDFYTDFDFRGVALFAFLTALFTSVMVLFGGAIYAKAKQMLGIAKEIGKNVAAGGNVDDIQRSLSKIKEMPPKEANGKEEEANKALLPDKSSRMAPRPSDRNPLYDEEEGGSTLAPSVAH